MGATVLPTSFQVPAAGDTAVVAPTAALLPACRYPSSPTFTGVRDGFACETWLTQVRRFFRGAQILDVNRTVTAIADLGEAGLLRWDGQYRSDTDWLDFEKAFREEFRPAGFHERIRALLFSIKMTSTVAVNITFTLNNADALGVLPTAQSIMDWRTQPSGEIARGFASVGLFSTDQIMDEGLEATITGVASSASGLQQNDAG
ncbi:hypothetical protein BC939DRAFT_498298 [Gamsiella multidivaricata]|uniref:uncharacterized protein n=1 Tax=Gamsiella multidivaricata TaxID=101098 RepID=UPI00221F1F8B|nr:uncharacterized protein BC939DRAFT_498298 [Gamsiella multidivaricata]KAI7832203.1 hypothetical protein BC939DRAFT_498298 [Gamsiella multidivaricata]